MAAKVLITIVSLLALAQVNGLEVNGDGRIKIKVVTTSGCGDTVRFIENLTVAYRLYGEFLDIEFVPWGRSQWDGFGEIQCQFGAPDCWANRLHRCALNILKNDKTAQMNYMTCEFSPPYPSFIEGSYQCAESSGLNLNELENCVANNLDDLDREAQQAASAPMASLDFVPAIVFNDLINWELHWASQTRLVNMICLALAKHPGTGIRSCHRTAYVD